MALGRLTGHDGVDDSAAVPVGAVLLDAMGTLVALAPPQAALARSLQSRLGLTVSVSEAGAALRAEITYYRAHHDDGHDAESLQRLRLRCATVLRNALPAAGRRFSAQEVLPSLLAALTFTRFDDAVPTLAALRARGLRLAVVSNWDVSLHGVLRELGLAERLDAIVTSAEVGVAKPGGAIFAAALERLGVDGGSAVHVGDSVEHDVVGAQRSGLRAVLLSRTPGVPAPTTVAVIASLAELPDLL